MNKDLNELVLEISKLFPDIKILKLLGSGAFANVFLIEMNKTEIIVLRVEKITRRENIDKLKARYESFMNIDNPYIQKIYDINIKMIKNELYFFVLSEFIDGVELTFASQILLSSPDPIKLKFDIARGLLEGLKVMHEHGLYHRDIKPTNIMLRNNGIPVFIDFGGICNINNLKETDCVNYFGNHLTNSPIDKSPVSVDYFYSQGYTLSAMCDPKIKSLYYSGQIDEIKNNTYLESMLTVIDIWGVMFCIVYIEHMSNNKIETWNDIYNKKMNMNGLVSPAPNRVNCGVTVGDIYAKIEKNWLNYMNDKNKMFYSLYQAYLKGSDIDNLISSISNSQDYTCQKWLNNPEVNPITGRKIKIGASTYNKFEKKCSPKKSSPKKPSGKKSSPKKTTKEIDKKICDEWLNNPEVNPVTGRKIKIGAATYNKLEKECSPKKSSPKKSSGKKSSPKKTDKLCKEIIKTGKRKGEECGAKAKYKEGKKDCCKRHYTG